MALRSVSRILEAIVSIIRTLREYLSCGNIASLITPWALLALHVLLRNDITDFEVSVIREAGFEVE